MACSPLGIMGPLARTAQEPGFPPEVPALPIARERLGLPRDPAWDDVLENLAPLPVEDGRYVLCEEVKDIWTTWN